MSVKYDEEKLKFVRGMHRALILFCCTILLFTLSTKPFEAYDKSIEELIELMQFSQEGIDFYQCFASSSVTNYIDTTSGLQSITKIIDKLELEINLLDEFRIISSLRIPNLRKSKTLRQIEDSLNYNNDGIVFLNPMRPRFLSGGYGFVFAIIDKDTIDFTKPQENLNRHLSPRLLKDLNIAILRTSRSDVSSNDCGLSITHSASDPYMSEIPYGIWELGFKTKRALYPKDTLVYFILPEFAIPLAQARSEIGLDTLPLNLPFTFFNQNYNSIYSADSIFLKNTKSFWPQVRNLSPSEAYSAVVQEREKNDGKLPLLGLKIDQGIVKWGGFFATLALLIHFIISLDFLKGVQLGNYPWIPLLRTRFAQGVTKLGLLILPTLSNLWCFWKFETPYQNGVTKWLWLILISIVLLLLSIYAISKIDSIRKDSSLSS